MQMKATSKRALALLLTLALLTVSLIVLLPVATSADPEEIQDFSYQTVKNDDVSSASTQLRFVFTIGTLDYERAGFVFSLTNDEPKVDGDGCHVVEATAAYRTITADEVATPAPNDRYWIAAKLTNIGHISFFTPIYVSAFVDDGTEITYETKSVTVLEAFGAEVYDQSATKMFLKHKTAPEMLNGDHFYPTAQHPNGLDAYFEIDVLWNETMANSTGNAFKFCLNYQGGNGDNFFYFYPMDNASGAWCKFAGGFDAGWGEGVSSILEGPPGQKNQSKENYPNLGEYGWHRIGFRIHQAAALEAGNVVYSGVASLYIDGALVWKTEMNMNNVNTHHNLLFTATNNAGVLTYADNPNADKVRMQLRGHDANFGGTDPFYFIYKNVSWSVVDPSWTPDVEPVADPVASTIKIAGNNYSDAFYFAPKN